MTARESQVRGRWRLEDGELVQYHGNRAAVTPPAEPSKPQPKQDRK